MHRDILFILFSVIISHIFILFPYTTLYRSFELVDELNITEDVIFLGRQKNISDLISISDLLLLMSEQESFGLVILEAMACEVPSIGTNVGGIPRSEEHTSELQSRGHLVCRLLL